MDAQLDHRAGFAAFGIIVMFLVLLLFGYMLLQDFESLLITGSPHVLSGTGHRSAWFRDLDAWSRGWLSILFAGSMAIYSVRVCWSWLHIILAPEAIVRLHNGYFYFNKGVLLDSPVALSNIDSIDLSFDPHEPNSRHQQLLWGDGTNLLSIVVRKPGGGVKTIRFSARRIVGGCDALAKFAITTRAVHSAAKHLDLHLLSGR